MHGCVARNEAGAVCGRPTVIFDVVRKGRVCTTHAPRLYTAGDGVRIRRHSAEGLYLPRYGEIGKVEAIYEDGNYEVLFDDGVKYSYYDWELEPVK